MTGDEKTAVPRLFGTNGARGVANEEIDPIFAIKMGMSVALSLKERTEKPRVIVGTDTRLSRDMIKTGVIAGLLAAGADVVDVGTVPSPALQYAVGTNKNADAGIIITASHNPPEFNGVKCISADGTEMSREEEEEIERIFFSEPEGVEWDRTGELTYDDKVNEEYVASVLKHVNRDAIRSRNFRVVLDCANGAGSHTSPYLLAALGCSVVSINCHPDGRFPGHPSEPSEKNLKDIIAIVKDLGADIGIVHDGDADRAIFIDENGNYISGDISLAIFAREIVTEKRENGLERPKVVTPIDSSTAVEDVVRSSGGEVVYTKIGSPIVARKMKSSGAVFGGEGNGGAIFPEHQYCRDGGMAAAKMLEIMALRGKLSELARDIPQYHQLKIGINYAETLKNGDNIPETRNRLMEKLNKKLSEKTFFTFNIKKVDLKDGIKLYVEVEGDSAWVLIRPSGTEPIIRVSAESSIEKASRMLIAEMQRAVKELLEADEKKEC